MKTLKPKPRCYSHFDSFPKDVDRIVKVMQERGYEISREDAETIWEDCSENWAAGWLILPTSDDELAKEILSNSIVK